MDPVTSSPHFSQNNFTRNFLKKIFLNYTFSKNINTFSFKKMEVKQGLNKNNVIRNENYLGLDKTSKLDMNRTKRSNSILLKLYIQMDIRIEN